MSKRKTREKIESLSLARTHHAPHHSIRSQFQPHWIRQKKKRRVLTLFLVSLFCSSHFYFYYLNEPMRSFIIQKRLPFFFALYLSLRFVYACVFVSAFIKSHVVIERAMVDWWLNLTAFKNTNIDIMNTGKWWINRFIIIIKRAPEYANGY